MSSSPLWTGLRKAAAFPTVCPVAPIEEKGRMEKRKVFDRSYYLGWVMHAIGHRSVSYLAMSFRCSGSTIGKARMAP